MRKGKNVWQRHDEIVDLYDQVFCDNLGSFGIHDRDTWIALNNRVGSLSEAFRMDEAGDVLRSVLPLAIAAKVKADGLVVVPMAEIYRVATSYVAWVSRRFDSDDSQLAEFKQLLERWVYVSGLEDAMKANAANTTGTSYMHLESLNNQAVQLQEHGQCEEAEKIHRQVIAQLAQDGLPNSGLSKLSHYNLMMAFLRRGRDSEAFAYREEHRALIAPMEAIFRTLEERLEEREQMRKTYQEAEERIAKGTLRRSDEWWRRNNVSVRRWGARIGRDVVPPE
jgi:tetratricopeptide (TPR) repeat protein